MLVCITGISGVGKTTILNELLKKGYQVEFLDSIIHESYLFNNEGYKIIKKNFGSEFINQREVDRKKLGNLVFNNSEQLENLNNLVEPLIIKAILKLKKRSEKNNMIIVEAAALLNNYDKYAPFFDKIILIKAPKKLIEANLKVKFRHLGDSFKNPIKLLKNLNFDFIINNNGSIQKACKSLENYLNIVKP